MKKRSCIAGVLSSVPVQGCNAFVTILSVFLTGLLLIVCAAWLLGIRFYAVTGSSMEPLLSVGDIAVVDTNRPVEEGNVIAFIPDPSLDVMVTHRVIGVSEEGYTTRGDANDAADFRKVPAQNVKGVMIGKIPKAGMIILRLKGVGGGMNE